MKRCILLPVAFLLILASSCGGRKETGQPSVAAPAAREMQLPDVPDTLTMPEDRAAYLALHFWDYTDFNDGLLLRDTAFVEQAVVDYLTILALAPDEVQKPAAKSLVDKISGSRTAFALVGDMLEKYLGETESPMQDSRMYLRFVQPLAERSQRVDPEQAVVWDGRLELAMLNREGSVAADFEIELRNGSRTTLHKAVKQRPYTLLIFYDPDCEVCGHILAQLAENGLPGSVQLIAVDAEGDHDKWARHCGGLPAQWTVGYALTPILDNGLYHLPGMPSLYLLDEAGTVMLKDFRAESLGTVLGHISAKNLRTKLR